MHAILSEEGKQKHAGLQLHAQGVLGFKIWGSAQEIVGSCAQARTTREIPLPLDCLNI